MGLREEGEREDRCRQSQELLKVETRGNESGICTHLQKLSLYIGSNRSLGLKALWFKLLSNRSNIVAGAVFGQLLCTLGLPTYTY